MLNVRFATADLRRVDRLRSAGNEAAEALLGCYDVETGTAHPGCLRAALDALGADELPGSVLNKLTRLVGGQGVGESMKELATEPGSTETSNGAAEVAPPPADPAGANGEETEMNSSVRTATRKRAPARPAGKKTATRAGAKKTAKAAKPAAAVKTKAKAERRTGLERRGSRGSVKEGVFSDTPAGLIQKLLLEGKHTDYEIWQQTKDRYKLPEWKAGYVNWLRFHMRNRLGMKVPNRIEKKGVPKLVVPPRPDAAGRKVAAAPKKKATRSAKK